MPWVYNHLNERVFEYKTMKNYLQENKVKIAEQAKAYRLKHQDKITQYQHTYNPTYYQQNKDTIKENNKQYQEKNKESYQISSAKYRFQNRERLKEYKRSVHSFQKSWGGDFRTQNNLLKIDVTLFL